MVLPNLPENLQVKARVEINEVVNRVPDDLNHIKEWISKQPQLNARTDDLWLLNFLRACKFNLEKTKQKLELFYSVRNSLPEFFDNTDPFSPEIQEILKQGILVPLVSEKFNGLLIRWKGVDPRKVSLVNIIKVGLMVFHIGLYENSNFMVLSQYIIDDFQNFSLGYILQITPVLLRTLLGQLLKAYPYRLGGFYCINTPNAMKTVIDMAKDLLSEKLSKRLHCYGEFKSSNLEEFIPDDLIPEEYGGKGPSVNVIAEEWKKKVESYRDWFIEDSQYCVDESKMPNKSENWPTMFGMEGNFRKLDID